MKTKILSVAVGVACALGVIGLPPTASAAGGDLAGTWTSTDLDGSSQTLRVTGAGNPVYAMFLVDDATSGICGGSPAKLVGSGVVDGTELLMRGALVCLPGGNPIGGRIFYSFEYDAVADTLTDSVGVVWDRAS